MALGLCQASDTVSRSEHTLFNGMSPHEHACNAGHAWLVPQQLSQCEQHWECASIARMPPDLLLSIWRDGTDPCSRFTFHALHIVLEPADISVGQELAFHNGGSQDVIPWYIYMPGSSICVTRTRTGDRTESGRRSAASVRRHSGALGASHRASAWAWPSCDSCEPHERCAGGCSPCPSVWSGERSCAHSRGCDRCAGCWRGGAGAAAGYRGAGQSRLGTQSTPDCARVITRGLQPRTARHASTPGPQHDPSTVL